MVSKTDRLKFTFRKYERLRRRKEIDFVLQYGKKVFINGLILYIHKSPIEVKQSRLAVLVSSKVEKKAVKRNKFKRRIREIFRLNKHKILEPLDIVVIGTKSIIYARYKILEEYFLEAIKKYFGIKEVADDETIKKIS
ncbi:MAG: ribonuclease P protein component [Endomicrobia bacterium]|nr:ribonuclease P protein component [Endomicrobiia bacterium]MCX7940699.1 ribonuclease P protein component [Endomicrobiia bacterium]MDW8055742.1 ribonuclease P protein component [Elusimicrobiota bacterium]